MIKCDNVCYFNSDFVLFPLGFLNIKLCVISVLSGHHDFNIKEQRPEKP